MKIPVKSLRQVNWLMAIVSGSFIGIFIFTYSGIHGEEIYGVVNAIIGMLVVSYFHILVLIKIEKYGSHLSFQKRRLYRYGITFVTTLLFTVCTSPVRSLFADESWRKITFEQQLVTIIVGSIGLNTIILILHNLVIIYQARNETEIENAELKAANAEANNQLLKQQIHPHFLFNALSILKTLYKKDVHAGDAYIVHLANFLRAAISDSSAKMVRLNDEIKLCTDYIAMQKIRFGDALQYRMDIAAAESSNGYVPSFSLQPLLENAIKHNDITDEQPLTIRVYTDNGYVVVTNNLQRKKRPVPSTGKGLANLMKRYELLSGDDVIIAEDETHFSVRLKILKA